MRVTFRFRGVPFVVTVMLIVIGLALAQWQTRRGDEKQAIEHALLTRQSAPVLHLEQVPKDVATIEFRRVRVRGEFVAEWPVYVDNRPYLGRAGFYLLMPFRMAHDGTHVLVMRGWIPRDVQDRTRLPTLVTAEGMQEIEGTVRTGVARVLELGGQTPLHPAAIVQNVDVTALAQASGLQLLPLFIEQSGGLDDGMVRDWPRPSSGVDKHRGYAFQWYGLSLMALIFFVVTGCRRDRK